MFKWLRTRQSPAAPSVAPVERPSAWKVPVAELGERMDYLEAAHNKLRGQVTGAKRLKGADPVEVESSEVDRKPAIAQESEPDRWQQLSVARAARRTRA